MHSMEGVLKNNWSVPRAKIILFICDWYFNFSIGIFEGFLQRSNFVEKLQMADLGYAPTILLL